jgi:hypothetical protein
VQTTQHLQMPNLSPRTFTANLWKKMNSNTDTETLPHIICHCIPYMRSITSRHDQVLKRLTNSIHCGSYTIDQMVWGAPGNNRPDLVVRDGNKVTIIDVTCPFENDEVALVSATERKETKYRYLIDNFRSLNLQAKVRWMKGEQFFKERFKS